MPICYICRTESPNPSLFRSIVGVKLCETCFNYMSRRVLALADTMRRDKKNKTALLNSRMYSTQPKLTQSKEEV